MALRNQPYLALYIQDFMTDEKLSECSASATGVYVRLMCLMHKSEKYGTILLKQKYKQTDNQIKNFACQVSKLMPYDLVTVTGALTELVGENVLSIEGDILTQKRMVKDNEISEKRALAGKNGGEKTQVNNKHFAKSKTQAKGKANYEYEYEYKDEDEIKGLIKGSVVPEMIQMYSDVFKDYPVDEVSDFPSMLSIVYKIAKEKAISKIDAIGKKSEDVKHRWGQIVQFAYYDKWFKTRSISDLNKEWQRLINSINGTDKQNNQQPASGKPGTSEARVEALKNWGRTEVPTGS